MSKVYTSTSLILLLFFCSFNQQQTTTGKQLYDKNCIRCHGADGTSGFLFAKNLQKSKIDDAAITLIIQNGQRFMPSFKKKFTADEINQVAGYVKTLRK